MNKFSAANELFSIESHYELNESQKDAIDEAIMCLYKEHIKLIGGDNHSALRCYGCKRPIIMTAYKTEREEEGFNTYYGKCPYCGRKYEWNNCYWR